MDAQTIRYRGGKNLRLRCEGMMYCSPAPAPLLHYQDSIVEIMQTG